MLAQKDKRPVGAWKKVAAWMGMLGMTLAVPALAQDIAPRTIVHEIGETVVEGTPQRIVALEFSFVDALDSLGTLPVGIADDNQPERIAQLLGREVDYASVGTRLEPNLELVSALQPDLIIADERRHAAIYEQLSAIAPTIVLNSWDGIYDDIKEAIVAIGDALGDKAAGERVVAEHEATMTALADRIPDDESRRFLLVVATPDAWSPHTSASFSGSIFATLGIAPAVEADVPVESGVGLERLVAINPDVIFVASDPGGTIFDQVQDNSAWTGIAAVQNGLVFQVDRNRYARFRDLSTAEQIANDILENVYDGN